MRATRRGWTYLAHGLAVAGSVMVAFGIGQGVAEGQTGSSVISGTVFNDLNGDGVRQSSEPGIGAVGIQLRDSANQFLGSTSTSQNGSYSFTGLEPGTYRVLEVANPPGYSVDTTTNMIVVNLGEDADGVDFGDARGEGEGDSSVSVTGVVFVDEDADGTFDPGEEAATGTRILIADEEYAPIIWLHPEPDASISWEGDAGGPVVIRALPPEGWAGTTDLVAWADPGVDNRFAFGVAPPAPPTTTTTVPPPTTTAAPIGAQPGGDPGVPATTTTTRAADVPINAALAPVPDDPTPRTTSTTISLEVAGAQASRLAASGRDSGDNASSGAKLIAAGVATLAASFVLRRTEPAQNARRHHAGAVG